MTPFECFVCTESEPVPPKSACKCTDRYIHDACLAKMLETAQHARCPVCAAPYANVVDRFVVVGVSPCGRGGIVLGAAVVGTVLISCAVNTWNAYLRTSLSARGDFILCFAGILMSCLGFASFAFVGHECVAVGPYALAQSTLVRKRKVRVTRECGAEHAL